MQGAPADVLACCSRALGVGGLRPLDGETRARLRADADAMARRGLRVLALADVEDARTEPALAEQDLVFVGLVALGVMPVLAIDLGTDMAPALALGAEPPEPNLMQCPPRPAGAPIVTRGLLVRAYLWLGAIQASAVRLAFGLHL